MNAKDYQPIRDYAIIGDGHTAALVARDGSVDWFCCPRFDSAALFCRLLDANKGGRFRVGPVGEHESTRAYIDGTNVLTTTFRTSGGEFRLTDFMPVRRSDREGEHEPRILRLVEGLSGNSEAEVHFEPTFDYAREPARLAMCTGGLVARSAAGESLALSCSEKFVMAEAGARCRLRIRANQRIWIALNCARDAKPDDFQIEDAESELQRTCDHWHRWSAACSYDGPYLEFVRRSALVLKLLVHEPTGALVAAPTTSLPEVIGGGSNWDYRFTWLRDSALTLDALELIGYHDEAMRFLEWLEDLCLCEDGLHIVYRLNGSGRLSEQTLDHLEGYRGSRPVRIGNVAGTQAQLDVYGQIIDAVFVCHERLPRPMRPQLWSRLHDLADEAAARWREPDRGPWEIRGEPRHFVYSKLLCWVALDRALRIAGRLGEKGSHLERWQTEREQVRDAILSRGFNQKLGAFTYAFDEPVLDSSVLAIPLVGFLPATDPRMESTIEKIREGLGVRDLIFRNLTKDLRGEGTFSLCSFWLVENLTLAGRIDEARTLFERIVGFANDVGLLAEEIDPETGEFLGNFPQGYTHLALIRSAVRLAHADASAQGSGAARADSAMPRGR